MVISCFSIMDERGFSLNYPMSKNCLPANTQVRHGCLMTAVADWHRSQVWMQPIQKLLGACLIEFFSWLLLKVFPDDQLVLGQHLYLSRRQYASVSDFVWVSLRHPVATALLAWVKLHWTFFRASQTPGYLQSFVSPTSKRWWRRFMPNSLCRTCWIRT